MTDCAGRRGSAFESRPAHKSPDFGLTRESATSGDIGKSGNRDFEISSRIHGGGLLDFGGAFSDVSAVCLGKSSRRKLIPEPDRLRRPAGVRVREPPRPQVARFRADAGICDFRRPWEIRKSGFRDLVTNSWGRPIRFRRRVLRRLRRVFGREFPVETDSGN